MTLAFRPDEASPLVDALFADLGVAPERAIDSRDEILAFFAAGHQGDRERALFDYFRSGASIADSLGQILRWRFGDPGRIGALLDFASGYGRVTRFLVREIPPPRLWVADVYADGVAFQQERFGVHSVISTLRPEDFSLDRRFDAILVTSLFTHLPEERFTGWLRVLYRLLNPGGLLVFSAHSPDLLLPGMETSAEGFRFEATSESGSLDTSDYGSAWVTEEFVRGALEQAAGLGGVSLLPIERGLCNYQDLYLAVPEPGVDFSSLGFHGEPELFLERYELAADGRLDLKGWAVVRSGELHEIEIVLDGERLAAAPVDEPRPEVAELLGGDRYLRSGWLCSCRLPPRVSYSSSVLLLRVVDARGVGHPLWAGSIEALQLLAWRNHAAWLRRKLKHVEAVLGEERARTAVEAGALQARIAAMEASRFWKLRTAWFRLKQRLGLAGDD
ncbi:MAG TPA: class I SAM-dependent methyltransferase [Thermoanaerobaculia bacterium]|jgi:SAM-dependent methyltransferase|nr:class I SAM-dependent methyltransferase [Thermoanaerobaculia bacterium]